MGKRGGGGGGGFFVGGGCREGYVRYGGICMERREVGACGCWVAYAGMGWLRIASELSGVEVDVASLR